MYARIAALTAAGLLAAACTQGYGGYGGGYGSMSPQQQRAVQGGAIGAGVGAIAGAAVNDDDLEGALIGGAVGAAVGAGVGAATAPRNRGASAQSELYYDQAANRYFYVDQRTGRTYWENGQVRSY